MNHIIHTQKKYLTEIIRIISMYQVLSINQLIQLFPDISKEKTLMLVKQLERNGRLVYEQETGYVFYSKDSTPNPSILSAFWVLIDFIQDITFHSASDFPVTLTFYTSSDCYDVIHVPEQKEILINHALSQHDEDAPQRLVIVEHTKQIPLLHFPGITAFCTISPDGHVQYFKKQGVTEQ